MRYRGIGPEKGRTVEEPFSYEYAKAHLDELSEQDKKEFVEWFFSGNWYKEDEDDIRETGEDSKGTEGPEEFEVFLRQFDVS